MFKISGIGVAAARSAKLCRVATGSVMSIAGRNGRNASSSGFMRTIFTVTPSAIARQLSGIPA
ncbi:hypothetical protein [Streptomyces buecherae]|uniref:hypothetical protein n=1 Tax=Streptomyces buecherae TaxID=2763006 RepID=UPI0020B63E9C|nr:hypothetical protein [Streptomyces buecherae]